MRVLGIDPGINGGLAIVALGEAGRVTYMRPSILSLSHILSVGEDTDRRIDVRATMRWIRQHPPDHCYIESVHSHPNDGAIQAFRYGRAVGALESIVQGLMIPMTWVTPQAWKKAHGLLRPAEVLPGDWAKQAKEASRQHAIKIFRKPELFPLRKDHGPAEACLVAWYGLMQMKVTGGLRAAE